ncbi:MADS-box transcription factor [Parasponia andersonii]|uniref:MADS-box transcription factor n=1 Tax=Parasponia andersonii TaxID=3476 RepID=A0A2P5C2D1_PARAD|nr:MADS-box transcription factor [Parasponia andersonii]
MVKNPMISKGHKKIEMVKIQNKNNLQVTFSKRRSGLFKKASELCTLCGVEIAIIAFSPAEKPFSFGHTEFGAIVNRFLTNQNHYSSLSSNISSTSTTNSYGQLHQNSDHVVHELNAQLSRLLSELEAEKKKGRELDEMRKAGQRMWWWESAIDELMSLDELKQFKASLEELKNNVVLTRQAHTMLNNVFEVKPNDFSTNKFYNFGSGHGVF